MTTRLSRREWLAAAALCSASTQASAQTAPQHRPLTGETTLGQLVSHPAFTGFGRRILPWDDRAFDENARLSAIGSLLPYHTQVDVPSTIDALNRLIEDAGRGQQIFYELHDDEARPADPGKSRAGLFFQRGKAEFEREVELRIALPNLASTTRKRRRRSGDGGLRCRVRRVTSFSTLIALMAGRSTEV